MGKISDDLKQRLLATKTEAEFAKIVFKEHILFDEWESDLETKSHFEKIRYKIEYASEHNIGYLRERKKQI